MGKRVALRRSRSRDKGAAAAKSGQPEGAEGDSHMLQDALAGVIAQARKRERER